MASESRGAFLSTIGEGLQKLGPQYAGMKQMEYENLAELAKRDRIESFEIMKMGMSDQMSREQIGLKHQLDMEGKTRQAELDLEPAQKLTMKQY